MNLTLGVLRAESDGDPRAISDQKAYGCMQILESTAKHIGNALLGMEHPEMLYKWLGNPEVSIYASAVYLNRIKRRYVLSDERFIILGYKEGPNGVYDSMKRYAVDVAGLDPELISKENPKPFEDWLAGLNEKECDDMFEYLMQGVKGKNKDLKVQEEYRAAVRNYIECAIDSRDAFTKIGSQR